MTTKKHRTALLRKPVSADDVVIRAVRLGAAIEARLALFMRDYGLTTLQFNVLRILYVRDAQGAGLPSGEIGVRLLVRVPDVTRLIDRVESVGLVERVRTAADRRLVKVRLTAAGTALVERIHAPLIQHSRDLFSRMAERDLEQLALLLDRAYRTMDPEEQKKSSGS